MRKFNRTQWFLKIRNDIEQMQKNKSEALYWEVQAFVSSLFFGDIITESSMSRIKILVRKKANKIPKQLLRQHLTPAA